jgi:hypothetical protein
MMIAIFLNIFTVQLRNNLEFHGLSIFVFCEFWMPSHADQRQQDTDQPQQRQIQRQQMQRRGQLRSHSMENTRKNSSRSPRKTAGFAPICSVVLMLFGVS